MPVKIFQFIMYGKVTGKCDEHSRDDAVVCRFPQDIHGSAIFADRGSNVKGGEDRGAHGEESKLGKMPARTRSKRETKVHLTTRCAWV